MRDIRSILVVIELDHPQDAALRHATLIARGTGAELHLLAFDPFTDRTEQLATIADGLKEQGHVTTIRQERSEPDYQRIIAAQLAEGCGLVVKNHLPDNTLKRTLITPEDWKLLRYCPAPVLLAKNGANWHGGKVLAAVDVDSTDKDHLALHSKIVEFGFDLAALLNGELHVLSAHPTTVLPASDPTKTLQGTLEGRYQAACEAFQNEYGVAKECLHVRQGTADVLIPQVARELQAAVCVLGSVARTGFSGVLMGNTAELVLDLLESDVLVIKPEAIAEHLEELASRE